MVLLDDLDGNGVGDLSVLADREAEESEDYADAKDENDIQLLVVLQDV